MSSGLPLHDVACSAAAAAVADESFSRVGRGEPAADAKRISRTMSATYLSPLVVEAAVLNGKAQMVVVVTRIGDEILVILRCHAEGYVVAAEPAGRRDDTGLLGSGDSPSLTEGTRAEAE